MNDNTKSMIVVGIVLLLILIPFIYVIISLKNTNNSINGHPISGSDTDSKMMNNMHGNQQTSDDGLNKDIQEIKFRDAVGKKAPDFILKNQDGGTFKLSDNIGKKDIILFFNEGAMCYPACWQQIAALGKDERLNNENVVSVSVLVDPKEKWTQVINSEPAFQKSTMLFDTAQRVSNAYDVLNLESSMHKGSYPGHTYFIINKEGIIIYKLDDPNMALNNELLVSKLNELGA